MNLARKIFINVGLGVVSLIALRHVYNSVFPKPPHGELFFPSNEKKSFSPNTWYAMHLKAMHEPSLYQQRFNTGPEFRFLYLPTFHKPTAVRIKRTPGGAELRAVRLNGAGGYDPGEIEFQLVRQLDEASWKHFTTLIEKASFWTSPTKEDFQSGNDGSRWILEGRSNGQYNFLDRWSPASNEPERKIGPFLDCCTNLRELAEFPKNGEPSY